MSYDEAAVEKTLTDWVESVFTGAGARIPWFEEQENGTRPNVEFCSIRLRDIQPLGRDYSFTTDEPGVIDPDRVLEYTHCRREITASVNIIRGSVGDDMAKLKASVAFAPVREIFCAGGIGYASATGSINLSDIVKGSYEPRRQSDFIFNLAYTEVQEIDRIDSVVITHTGYPPFTVDANSGP